MRHNISTDDMRDTRYIGRNNLNQLVHQHLGSDSFMVVAEVYKAMPALKAVYDALPQIDTLSRIEPSLKELAVHTPELNAIVQSLPALKELYHYLPNLVQNSEYIRDFIGNFECYQNQVLELPELKERVGNLEASLSLIVDALENQLKCQDGSDEVTNEIIEDNLKG